MPRAKLLPMDKADCGWYETLPPPAAANELVGDQRFDYAIIGAGFAGLAAARRLAQLLPEAAIALIEAQRVGFGSAGRNTGFMIDLPHDLASDDYTGQQDADRKLIRQNRSAIQFARETVRDNAIDCDWREQGKLHGAVEPQGEAALRAFADGLDALGEPVARLDAADLKRITGSDFYRSGVHTPGTVTIQPAAFVRGCAATLPENVTLFENSPVGEFERQPDGRIEIVCPRGRLSADKLLLTNNGYAASFGVKPGRLIHVCTYGSMTRPMSDAEAAQLGGDEHWALIPANPLGSTVRRLANGRIVIRNTFTWNRNYRYGEGQRVAMRRAHEASFRNRFPMLAELGFDYTWGGVLCLSRNNANLFGELAEGVYGALCQNGLGVCRGTFSGRTLAELVAGDDNDFVRDMLAAPRPAACPPQPFLGLGVSATLAWKERRAGLEK